MWKKEFKCDNIINNTKMINHDDAAKEKNNKCNSNWL